MQEWSEKKQDRLSVASSSLLDKKNETFTPE